MFSSSKKGWSIGIQVERDGYYCIRYLKTHTTKAVNWTQKWQIE